MNSIHKVLNTAFFKFLYRILGYAEYSYLVNHSKAYVKDQLDLLFSSRDNSRRSPNLKGAFTGTDTFTVTPKRFWENIRGFEREPSFLEGHLFSIDEGQTKMQVFIRPNGLFIFILLFVMIYILITVILCIVRMNIGFFDVFPLIIVVPLILFVPKKNVRKLKTNFEKHFNLQPLGDRV